MSSPAAAAQSTSSATAKRLLQKISFLGTSSGVPTPFRNVSSYCLSFTDGAVWMFDCGEGTQHRLQQCNSLSLGKIERIFITHLHGDHCYGLPGLMCSLAMTWGKKNPSGHNATTTTVEGGDDDENVEQEQEEDHDDHKKELVFKPFLPHSEYLEIVGPEKLGDYLRGVLKASEAYFPFKYRVTELLKSDCKLPEKEPEYHWCEAPSVFIKKCSQEGVYKDFLPTTTTFSINNQTTQTSTLGISVSAAPLHHPVYCVGYLLTEPMTPGALDMEKAMKLKVPKGPLLSKLKNGETISFPADPKQPAPTETNPIITVTSSQVVSAPVPGRSVLCLGDTCGSDECLKLLNNNNSENLEVIVHEATFDDANEKLALPRGHSTARQAGAFAARMGAKKLILTHFSARFPPRSKDEEPINRLISEGKQGALDEMKKKNQNKNTTEQENDSSSSSSAQCCCEVVAADDYSVFELVKKRK